MNPSVSEPMPGNTPQVTNKAYHWGWAAAGALITLITIACRYALPVRDGDLWWHMAYGKYFLANKTLIADHTLFSWTPSANEKIYCTWLADIFFYLLHKATGLTGLFAFRYLCLLTLVAACWLFARKLKIATHPLVWLIALIAVLMSYTAAFLKPEIFSFTLMTLMVWCWFHIRSQDAKGWGWCYLIPVIMLVWVNSHGGFVFGVVFLILAATGEVLNTWFSHGNRLSNQCRKHLSIALVLAAVTVFLTPYGYHYPLDLFYNLLPTKENMAYNLRISAYFAPFESSTPYHNFELYADGAILLLLALFLLNLKQKKIEWSSLLTNLCFAILYTKFLRTTFFWAPIFALSSIYMLHTVHFTFSSEKTKKIFRQAFPPVLLLILLSLSGFSLKKAYCTPETYLWMGFGNSYFNPVEEADYIKKYFPTSRIGNTYNEGGYLIWKLWPENKVFFDPRHFPYKSWSDDYFQSLYGLNTVALENIIRQYPAEIWCIGLNHVVPLLFFTQSPDWRIAYYGKNSALFVKKDIELPQKFPRVSPEIDNIKNLNTAATVLGFSTTIQDWQTTNTLLSAIKNNFTCGSQEFYYQWGITLRDGMQAYWKGDFSEAILKLGQLPALPISPDPPYLLDSYHRLMAQRWQRNDIKTALTLSAKLWTLSGKNLYATYNLGVIGWYFSTNVQQPSPVIDPADPPRWWHHLQTFLLQAQQTRDNEDARAIAQQILDGRFPEQTKPGLIVPGGT